MNVPSLMSRKSFWRISQGKKRMPRRMKFHEPHTDPAAHTSHLSPSRTLPKKSDIEIQDSHRTAYTIVRSWTRADSSDWGVRMVLRACVTCSWMAGDGARRNGRVSCISDIKMTSVNVLCLIAWVYDQESSYRPTLAVLPEGLPNSCGELDVA